MTGTYVQRLHLGVGGPGDEGAPRSLEVRTCGPADGASSGLLCFWGFPGIAGRFRDCRGTWVCPDSDAAAGDPSRTLPPRRGDRNQELPPEAG